VYEGKGVFSTEIRVLTYDEVADALNDLGWVVDGNNKARQPKEINDVQSEWKKRVRYLLYYALPGSTAVPTKFSPSSARSDAGISIPALPMQTYILDIDFSNVVSPNDGRSRVSLIRTADLQPGAGSITIDIAHRVTEDGVLKCTIPPQLLTTPYQDGGMGYSLYMAAGKPIKIVESPIKSLDVLHANVGDYSRVPLAENLFYQEKVRQIGLIIEAHKRELKRKIELFERLQTGRGGIVDYPPRPRIDQVLKYVKYIIARIDAEKAARRSVESLNAELSGMKELISGSNFLSVVIDDSITGSPVERQKQILTKDYNNFLAYSSSYATYAKDKTVRPDTATVANFYFERVIKTTWDIDLKNITFVELPQIYQTVWTKVTDRATLQTLDIQSVKAAGPVTAAPNTPYKSNVKYDGYRYLRSVGGYINTTDVYRATQTPLLKQNQWQTVMADHLRYMRIVTPQIKNQKTPRYTPPTIKLKKIGVPPSIEIRTGANAYPQTSTQKLPSLFGVKPVDPMLLGDGIGSPTNGIDRAGQDYTITYGPIQDTFSGTYDDDSLVDRRLEPIEPIEGLEELDRQNTAEEESAAEIIRLLNTTGSAASGSTTP
jgi:hypothetical protein